MDDLPRPMQRQTFSGRLTKLKLEKTGPRDRPVFLGITLKERHTQAYKGKGSQPGGGPVHQELMDMH
jgi:hypothetical protein